MAFAQNIFDPDDVPDLPDLPNIPDPDLPGEEAKERPVEIDYPDIPEIPEPETVESTPFTFYARYVFRFLVWGSGILAFLMLIYAGFKYITATGSPDKLRDAKSRIFSALLGLAIIAGSYAIMWRLSPQFVVFNLPSLEPLIETLDPGILACKEPFSVQLREMFELEREYMLDYPSRQRRKRIKKWLEIFQKELKEKCYYIKESGPIRSDFDNQIKELWAIPYYAYGHDNDGELIRKSEFHFGAAFFDRDGFDGIGSYSLWHFILPTPVPKGLVNIYSSKSKQPIEISSIYVMRHNLPSWEKGGDIPLPSIWSVEFYEDANYNVDFPDADGNVPARPFMETGGMMYWHTGDFVKDDDFVNVPPAPILVGPNANSAKHKEGDPLSPNSIKVTGNAMVMLFKGALDKNNKIVLSKRDLKEDDGQRGYFFKIFYDSDNILEDDLAIVDWVSCLEYQSIVIRPGNQEEPINKCAKPAADSMIILSDVIIL